MRNLTFASGVWPSIRNRRGERQICHFSADTPPAHRYRFSSTTGLSNPLCRLCRQSKPSQRIRSKPLRINNL